MAIDNSKNKDGLEYGRTRITVSTVGVGIKKDNMDAIEWAAKELDVFGLEFTQLNSVEFAIKLKDVLLPIDSHWPVEKYKAIDDAYNANNKEAQAECKKRFSCCI